MSRLCAYFGCSRNAYYKRSKAVEQASLAEPLLLELVQGERRVHPRMGGKKLYHLLREELQQVHPHFGRDKLLRFLREHGLQVKKRTSTPRTTSSHHRFHKYGNLVAGRPADGCNKVWAADITYIRTAKGFAYLSLLTDMYSRKIVGWALSGSLSIEGCQQALRRAFREHPQVEGLIHHSDRGVQYCSHGYVNMLNKRKVTISMTEENHCYENALAERVNGILKDEYLLDSVFGSYRDALNACREAVELYNTRRPHWALNLKTPQQVHQAA